MEFDIHFSSKVSKGEHGCSNDAVLHRNQLRPSGRSPQAVEEDIGCSRETRRKHTASEHDATIYIRPDIRFDSRFDSGGEHAGDSGCSDLENVARHHIPRRATLDVSVLDHLEGQRGESRKFDRSESIELLHQLRKFLWPPVTSCAGALDTGRLQQERGECGRGAEPIEGCDDRACDLLPDPKSRAGVAQKPPGPSPHRVDVPVTHTSSDCARSGNHCVPVVTRRTGSERSEQIGFDQDIPVQAEVRQTRVKHGEKSRRGSASQGDDDGQIRRTSRDSATQGTLGRESEGIDGGGDSDSRRVPCSGAPESATCPGHIEQHRPRRGTARVNCQNF